MRLSFLIPVIVIMLIFSYSYGWETGIFQNTLFRQNHNNGEFGGPYFIRNISGYQLVLHTVDKINVSVYRPYMFGLITLPLMFNGQNVGRIHTIFFYSMYSLLFLFVIIQIQIFKKNRNKKINYDTESDDIKDISNKTTEEVKDMGKDNEIWKKRVKFYGKGVLVLLLILITTGSWPAGVSTAFLYLYINHKFKKNLE